MGLHRDMLEIEAQEVRDLTQEILELVQNKPCGVAASALNWARHCVTEEAAPVGRAASSKHLFTGLDAFRALDQATLGPREAPGDAAQEGK